MIQLFNDDCMEVMAQYPDNYFDLAIVDPPYGGGHHEQHNHKGTIPAAFRRSIQKIPTELTDSKKKKNTNHATGGVFSKYDCSGGAALPDWRNMGIEIRRRHKRMGHCSAGGILFRITQGFKTSDYLGRKLLRTSAVQKLYYMAKTNHIGEF